MIFTVLIAIANYGIYKVCKLSCSPMPGIPLFRRQDTDPSPQSSIDYMIAAYGPYAASATGGNDLARDFLAGIAALYSTPCTSGLATLLPFPCAFLRH